MTPVRFHADGAPWTGYEPVGLTGFVSWRRLQEVLRAAGELKADEELTSYRIDDQGIVFNVRKTPKGPAGDRGQVGWMGGEFDR